jgi:hypothetical protein
MSRSRLVPFAAVLVGPALLLAAAKPSDESGDPAVASLIEQLGDAKFAKREEAARALFALGRPAIPQLRAALEQTRSAEVRRRLGQILERHRVRVEWYSDRAAFVKRLKAAPREVNFDDVDTSKEDFVPFAADRYAERLGIVITGQGGQYAGRTFGFPADFPPASAPNSYAPGPVAPRNGGPGAGGCRTNVTFTLKGRAAVTAAFGAVFIDADYPEAGPSSLRPFDAAGEPLGEAKVVQGPSGSHVFCGVVAVDGAGNLVPAIARVALVNGNNWPSVEPGEGVTLDDFLFAEPVPPVE